MKDVDVGELLCDADPLAREACLPADDARRMQRAIVDAAEDASIEAAGWWPRPMLVAATVAVTLAASVAVGRWLPAPDHAIARAGLPTSASASASRERRQLQFATPGGTRIIWVFDSDFNP
jgi:hypothetical protein